MRKFRKLSESILKLKKRIFLITGFLFFFLFLFWVGSKNFLFKQEASLNNKNKLSYFYYLKSPFQFKKSSNKNVYPKKLKRTAKISSPLKVWIEKKDSDRLLGSSNSRKNESIHLNSDNQEFTLKGNFQLSLQTESLHFEWILNPNLEIVSGSRDGEMKGFKKPFQISTVSLTLKRANHLKNSALESSSLKNNELNDTFPNEKIKENKVFLRVKDPRLGIQKTALIRL